MAAKRFIGYYNYTVILTYLGLVAALFGMTQCLYGRYKTAIVCLMIAGICDAFDGRVARRRTESTADERSFGVQLDSLCDMACYGIYPCLICYMLGVRGVVGLICIFFFAICALIRLAYFNVLEINRAAEGEGGPAKYYHGLPVTTISIILPIFFMTRFFVPHYIFVILLHLMLVGVGFAFIYDFRVPKLKLRGIVISMLVVLAMVISCFVLTHFEVPVFPQHPHGIPAYFDSHEPFQPAQPASPVGFPL